VSGLRKPLPFQEHSPDADESGCECVRNYRDEIAAMMAADEIEQAEGLAVEWNRRILDNQCPSIAGGSETD